MAKAKRASKILPKKVRTLALPKDFQLVVQGKDVRWVDARGHFTIRNRLFPSFRLVVRGVHRTIAKFVKFVAHKFVRWVERQGGLSALLASAEGVSSSKLWAIRFPRFDFRRPRFEWPRWMPRGLMEAEVAIRDLDFISPITAPLTEFLWNL